MKTPYGWSVNIPWEANPATLWRTRQTLELLAPDRWMDYWCEQPVDFPGYVPTIRSWHLDGAIPQAVYERLLANPTGETWLWLNEPNVSDQDDITPAKGRDLALKFINVARNLDVDMNWCGPNCSVNFPAQHAGRLSGQAWWREWLRLTRRAGIGGASIHGIHLYHCRSQAMLYETWASLVNDWRWQWIGDKPIVITEVCAEDLPLDKQIEVMDGCFELYKTGLREGPTGRNGAMGVYWFAGYDYGLWPNCALCEVDPGKLQTMRLTPLGQHWKSLQARLR